MRAHRGSSPCEYYFVILIVLYPCRLNSSNDILPEVRSSQTLRRPIERLKAAFFSSFVSYTLIIVYWFSRCKCTNFIWEFQIKPQKLVKECSQGDPLVSISFNTNGQVIYSKYLSMDDKKTLHLTDDLKLSKVNPNHIPYLKYHNNFCLLWQWHFMYSLVKK